jgi:cytochrome P450
VNDSPPIVDFDHNSREFAGDPAAAFRELRERCPVAYSNHHGGFWVFTKYREVAAVAHDDATYSSAAYPPGDQGKPILIPKPPRPLLSIPIELDPPDFYTYRRLLNPVLSPAAVDRLVPMMDRHVEHYLDEIAVRGECDFIHDFASPVPAAITIEWLGMDLADSRRLADLQHNVLSFPPGSPQQEAAYRDYPWMYARIKDAIADKRVRPAEDVITYLVNARPGGEPMSDETLLAIIQLLIAGGVDTTTSLTGQALMHLHRNHADRQRLIDEPELLRSATEEFLRVFCPVQALGRTVLDETEIAGYHLTKGERVLISWASANRDPDMFPDPEEVKLDRFPNRHMAFGLGIHRCAGSNLARVTFGRMITGVLRRIPDYEILEEGADPYPVQGVDSGFSHLPARYPVNESAGVS